MSSLAVRVLGLESDDDSPSLGAGGWGLVAQLFQPPVAVGRWQQGWSCGFSPRLWKKHMFSWFPSLVVSDHKPPASGEGLTPHRVLMFNFCSMWNSTPCFVTKNLSDVFCVVSNWALLLLFALTWIWRFRGKFRPIWTVSCKCGIIWDSFEMCEAQMYRKTSQLCLCLYFGGVCQHPGSQWVDFLHHFDEGESY